VEETMSASAIVGRSAVNRRIPFGVFARDVFLLDPAIEWFALEEAGREPGWVWRDQETGKLRGGTTSRAVR